MARASLADDVIEFAGRLRVGEGELVGRRLELLPWQRDFIRETFDRKRRRVILSVGRRNGKSALVAVLVLAALFGPLVVPQSRIISASRSREQAAIVFRYAVKMASVSGLLHLVHVREANKEIESPRYGTGFRSISADAVTAVGFGARLVIHDELGQVEGPRDALYEALSSGMGSYSNSLEVIISTQAPGDADLLSVLLDDALAGHDPAHYAVLHAAPAGCGLLDPEAWKAANPSLGRVRDPEDLRRMAEEAQRLPSRESAFRNFFLNQRVSSHSAFLTPSVWNACGGQPGDDVLRRGPCFGGLDLSSRTDLTALSVVAQDPEGVWHVRQYAWTPGGTLELRAKQDRAPYDVWRDAGWLEAPPGVSLDYALLARRLAEIAADHPFDAIGFDRWRIGELRRELDRLGVDLPLVEVGQGYKDMTPAVELTEQLALQGRIRHGNNPLLRWAIGNTAIMRDPSGNRKPDKAKAYGRIDPAVALMIAFKTTIGAEEAAARETDVLFA